MRSVAALARSVATRRAAVGTVVVCALAATAAGSASVMRSTLAVPSLVTPPPSATVQALPAFGWRGVAGADHYEFQIGADPSFNSPVLGYGHDSFATRNTWATLDESVPNGRYWWHVRAVTKSGGISPWSRPRLIQKQWSAVPRLLSPSSGAEVRFPTTPLVLRWSPVPYAAKYLLYLASDRNLGNLLSDRPVETHGISYSPPVTLADKHTYYWAVVPVDSQGNKGVRSRVASFTWRWRSETAPTVRDLVDASEQYDPQISWKPVPGAARYEIEINPSREWTVGSRVCCEDPVVTTTFSPPDLLPNNLYYYRVRAINVDGNAGLWTPSGEGTSAFSFNKVFDNYEDSGDTTIKNLRALDNFGVAWDAVPGASRYEVVIEGPSCPRGSAQASRVPCDVFTAVPAWTPLSRKNGSPPYPVPGVRVSMESPLAPGGYAVRVRAYTDDGIDRKDIYGNFTYTTLSLGYPSGGGGLSPSTYLTPVSGVVQQATPLFRWQPVGGAVGYWVIVARDRSFTTVADYAYTKVPAYAPRQSSGPKTYTDEETLYYWAILPELGPNTPPDPNLVPSADFHKRSLPPSVLQPAGNGTHVFGPPTFRWTPVTGAKYYQLQVSTDRNFGTQLDDVKTHSTAYTSTKTYSANAALYFRVRAVDEVNIGLTWSTARIFRDSLARPQLAPNESRGELIPTWVWRHVQGAIGYDVHVDLPNGTSRDFPHHLLTAFTANEMTGTGVFHWQVRAEFPEARGGRTAVGPYTRALAFTRIIPPPTGAREAVAPRSVLLSWNPKTGAEHYRLQIATSPDFGRTVENTTIDSTSFAPDFRSTQWTRSSTFYWRVAAVDADRNSGNYSPVRTFRLHLPKARF